MSNNGFIYLHRKLLNWEWYSDHNTTRLFIHLLLKANHAPHKWKGHQVNRGQVITGIHKLSTETGISVQSLRTSLKRLKSTSEITIKPTTKFSIITINNYNDMQSYNKQSTNNQQTTNKQLTTNNNDNNDNKNNNNTHVDEKILNKDNMKLDIDNQWQQIMGDWFDYKRERKESYKSKRSMMAAYNKLFKLSGGDMDTANEIIEQSMANNWAGLFELKKRKENTDVFNKYRNNQ